jgi:nucleoid DNA-binding protein
VQFQPSVEVWVGNANRELSSGSEVRLNNFGSFRVKHTGARTGRDPRTGEQSGSRGEQASIPARTQHSST